MQALKVCFEGSSITSLYPLKTLSLWTFSLIKIIMADEKKGPNTLSYLAQLNTVSPSLKAPQASKPSSIASFPTSFG